MNLMDDLPLFCFGLKCRTYSYQKEIVRQIKKNISGVFLNDDAEGLKSFYEPGRIDP
jgi:hypothetical protein